MAANTVLFVLLGLALIILTVNAEPSVNVESSILKTIEKNGSANLIIKFKGSDLVAVRENIQIQDFATRGERISSLYNALKNHADSTQASLVNSLQKAKVPQTAQIRQLWITNELSIKNADKDLLEFLSQRDDISEIEEEKISYIDKSIPAPAIQDVIADDVQWGVGAISAPDAWANGTKGQGIVVATMDTGVRWTHEALRGGFRKENGWFDVVTSTSEPTDDQGHGTHVTGTIVGRTNGIGVAPEAQWIACKSCDYQGSCYYTDSVRCAQWTICPTDSEGNNPRCDLAPHVISNSWGGGAESSNYDDMINAWKSAGIVVVFAAGNEGETGCSSVGSPGTHPDVISVGSIDEDNIVSTFSSRGPSRKYGSIQPDVAAPGGKVLSADYLKDTGYSTKSGTSMATPHVAGLIALLLSHKPDLTIRQVWFLILEGAQPVEPYFQESCGGVPDTVYPNNQVGAGRVDAIAAIEAIEIIPEFETTAATPVVTSTPSSPDDPTSPDTPTSAPSSTNALQILRLKEFTILSIVLFYVKNSFILF